MALEAMTLALFPMKKSQARRARLTKGVTTLRIRLQGTETSRTQTLRHLDHQRAASSRLRAGQSQT